MAARNFTKGTTMQSRRSNINIAKPVFPAYRVYGRCGDAACCFMCSLASYDVNSVLTRQIPPPLTIQEISIIFYKIVWIQSRAIFVVPAHAPSCTGCLVAGYFCCIGVLSSACYYGNCLCERSSIIANESGHFQE